MTAAALALQTALFARLTTDAGMLAAVGGPRIHDAVPQPPEFPYVTFGQSIVRDAASDLAAADEHQLTFHVWSRARGRAQTWQIIEALRTALHEQSIALDGHRLINLRLEFAEARRLTDADYIHGLARFRALTEPL
jgi:hypothetical protein